MCGRYSLHANPEVIALAFKLGLMPEIEARYNIAPGAKVLIVREDEASVGCASRTRRHSPASPSTSPGSIAKSVGRIPRLTYRVERRIRLPAVAGEQPLQLVLVLAGLN